MTSVSLLSVTPEGGAEITVDFVGAPTYSDRAASIEMELPVTITEKTAFYFDDITKSAVTFTASVNDTVIVSRPLREILTGKRTAKRVTVGMTDIDLAEAEEAFGGGSGTSPGLPAGFETTGDGADPRVLEITANTGQSEPPIQVYGEDAASVAYIGPTGAASFKGSLDAGGGGDTSWSIDPSSGRMALSGPDVGWIGLFASASKGQIEIDTQTGQAVPALVILNPGGDEVFKVNPAGTIIATGLPTADPTVAGALWNDAGTLKISAG